MPLIDNRLVQTAVLGGPGSDRPVILPEEPHNLDEFRRQFGTDRFWCGTLLGGCGEKVMTKRYETKVCHFSHYPDRHGGRAVCHRSANGVDSADHLFIKRHVTEWLAGQGHATRAELRSLGHGPGDAVDFWLRATQQHLRFELHPEDYRSWRKAADSLGAKEGHVEWVFGPDGAITRDVVARQGYALRVRCETAGNDRRVLIGTVTAERPVVWAPLEQCRMTRGGIVTPALRDLRPSGTIREGGRWHDPFPASLPLRGAGMVFAVDPGAKPSAGSLFAAPGRHLVSGFVKPAGSRIVRARLSLPDEIPLPTDQYIYQLAGSVQLLVTDSAVDGDSSWTIRADSLVRLNGLEAERTGLWRPSVALDQQVDAATRVPRSRPETSPPDSPRSADQRVAAQRLAELQAKLREAAHTLPRANGRRAARLAQAIERTEKHIRACQAAHRRSRTLADWLKTAEALLEELTRLIGRPIAVTHRPAFVQPAGTSNAPTAPPPAQQPGPKAPTSPPVQTPARGSAVQPSADAADNAQQGAHAEARTAFETLVHDIRAAQSAEDLAAVAAARHQAGSLYGQRLSPADREKYTPFMREVKAWCRAREPKRHVDPPLHRIRQLLAELGRPEETRSTDALGHTLHQIRQLRRELAAPLPTTEARTVQRWESRQRHRQRVEHRKDSATAASSAPERRAKDTAARRHAERLPGETLDKLATGVREILEETARIGGGLVTWEDLRLRMAGALPFLHPDDQRELLLAVDAETPAGSPLLCTLITSSGPSPHRLYLQVRSGLGRRHIPDAELAAHRANELRRLQQTWHRH